jgi:hypothetical protein
MSSKACETVTRLIDDGNGNLLTERVMLDSGGTRITKKIVHTKDGRYFTHTIHEGPFGFLEQEQSDDGTGKTSSRKSKSHNDGVTETVITTADKDNFVTSLSVVHDQIGNETSFYHEEKNGKRSELNKVVKVLADKTKVADISWTDSEGKTQKKTFKLPTKEQTVA